VPQLLTHDPALGSQPGLAVTHQAMTAIPDNVLSIPGRPETLQRG
jgi:hypothetical protein